MRTITSFVAATFLFFGFSLSSYASDETLVYNGRKIYYDAQLHPRCDLFIRHEADGNFGGYRLWDRLVGEDVGVYINGYKFTPSSFCEKYRSASDGDAIYVNKGSRNLFHRSDVISLDEMAAWDGIPPFRARFSIGPADGKPDDDIDRSYLPYLKENRIENYILIDENNYEINLLTNKRTGYRFYRYMEKCYLATERLPRVYKFLTVCVRDEDSFSIMPETRGVINGSWINIMMQNTVDLERIMPAENIQIGGSYPIRPLIYSDFPIDDVGRVAQGRAMCMADCAPGMLFRLLKKGQSIWGGSGKPPPQEKP